MIGRLSMEEIGAVGLDFVQLTSERQGQLGHCGDSKSVSHRALLCAGLLLPWESTFDCLEAMELGL